MPILLDAIAVVVVLVALVTAMASVRRFLPHASSETQRKVLHIFIGLSACVFPLVFTHRLSVVVLAALASVLLFALRRSRRLKAGLASSLHGVERKSHGEFYITLAILVLYLFHREYVAYLIAMLILTFADSIAALVGVNYAKKLLSGQQEDPKSQEGSLMLFLVAFLCTLIPLQLMTTVGRLDVLVIAFIIAILSTFIEAAAQTGIDNLLLPLLSHAFVQHSLHSSTRDLVETALSVVVFLVVSAIVYRFVRTSKVFIMSSILAGYIALILGGLPFLILGMLYYVLFGLFPRPNERERAFQMTYKVVQWNVVIPLLWAWGYSLWPTPLLFWCYGLSTTALLFLNTFNRYHSYTDVASLKALLFSFGKATLAFASVVILLEPLPLPLLGLFAVLLALLLCATPLLFRRFDMGDAIGVSAMVVKTTGVGVLSALFFVGGLLWTTLP